MPADKPSKKEPKANFSQDDVNKAVDYHVLDISMPRKGTLKYCVEKSNPDKGEYVGTKCGAYPEPVNCSLCNPVGKI